MPTCCIVLNVCDMQDDVDIYCSHFIVGASRASWRSFFHSGALVIHRVLQAVPAFCIGGVPARVLVPRAPVLVQVLENGQVPLCGCVTARARGPRAPVLVQVLENGQVPLFGCVRARVRVPRAPVLVQVLESGQVSICGCVTARDVTPSKVVLSRPLQQPYTPPHSSVFTYVVPHLHQEVQRLSRRVETELRRCPAGL